MNTTSRGVPEAAAALGVTVDAIRSRIKRSTIAHVREGGRVYVLLDTDQARPGHDQGADQHTGQGATSSEAHRQEIGENRSR
jgi:hypothetical protein